MNNTDLDSQLAQWQTAYKAATPNVNARLLTQQTKKAQFKLKCKGLVDLMLGLVVTCFCIYAAVFEATSLLQQLLISVLSPLPVGFGLWGYRVRQKQWQTEVLDVQSMLTFKETQLKQQLHYWKISLIWGSALWLGLLGIAIYNLVVSSEYMLWATQLGLNSFILLLVCLRYKKLKQRLPIQLMDIQLLR